MLIVSPSRGGLRLLVRPLGGLKGVTLLVVCSVCPLAVHTHWHCVHTSPALGSTGVALVQSSGMSLCTDLACCGVRAPSLCVSKALALLALG